MSSVLIEFKFLSFVKYRKMSILPMYFRTCIFFKIINNCFQALANRLGLTPESTISCFRRRLSPTFPDVRRRSSKRTKRSSYIMNGGTGIFTCPSQSRMLYATLKTFYVPFSVIRWNTPNYLLNPNLFTRA